MCPVLRAPACPGFAIMKYPMDGFGLSSREKRGAGNAEVACGPAYLCPHASAVLVVGVSHGWARVSVSVYVLSIAGSGCLLWCITSHTVFMVWAAQSGNG